MKIAVKKSTFRRTVAILLIFAVMGLYLLINIFRLDYFGYDYYRQKTYDQVTTSSLLYAKRGNIYDANMNILATSNTVWRVFISTRDIKAAQKADGKNYTEIISDGLSNILGIDKKSIYDKIAGSNVLDVTIKKSVEEKEYGQILEFIKKNGLERLVFTEASTSRYYPSSTLAAHTIGFTGSDNQGLYGIEYYYDDLLSGSDGYYVYAKDANGKALDTEYSSYFPATDGYSLVTTIDSYVQSELEAVIESARANHDAKNRVTGIVMDVKTGAIMAMATTSPFDPNSPFTLDTLSQKKLDESGYALGSEEYRKYKNELLQLMWSNKAVSETYEPGSTFKIVTVSSALDSGAVSERDTFSCPGYCNVGGYRIRCHKVTGHGSGFSLAYGLQMSCNPCMIAVSEKLGASAFYDYVKDFGYLEKTGIDLPSEAGTIFHKKENIGTTELATASFGQRFKVSVINQLTAIAAVANGGILVTPYVVDKVIDSEGKVISDKSVTVKRRVISEEAANAVSRMLIDGVSGNGGAKNAGVAGYDIAAKTGTSQKFDILDENGNSYLRIGSTVAYATDAEHGIAAIIVVDEPNSAVKYGSVVAAPYVSDLLEKILPYLDYQSSAENINVTVENFVGMNINSATERLSLNKMPYEIVGNGNVVIAQTPHGNETLTLPLSKIILYTVKEESNVSVPNLIGLDLVSAVQRAINSGLNIKISGMSLLSPNKNDIITEQSLPPGNIVVRGTVITIRAMTTDFED